MAEITADPAKELTAYFRINRDGSLTFNCVDSGGAAFSLAGHTIVANFKRRPNESTNFLQLTSGSGITVNASSFVLTLTKTQAAKFREQTWFLEIVVTVSAIEKTWITCNAVFHNGLFDGLTDSTETLTINTGAATVTMTINDSGAEPKIVWVACSDELTALTAGTAKRTFRMPFAMTVTSIRASLVTAQPSGSIFTVDINESGTTILSTKLTVDNTEKTSVTAATQPVISDATLADDAEMTVDIDQIGTSGATGLAIELIGR